MEEHEEKNERACHIEAMAVQWSKSDGGAIDVRDRF